MTTYTINESASTAGIQMNIAQRTVWKRVNLGIFGGVFGNSAQASKSVDTVNVHGTGATDTLSA